MVISMVVVVVTNVCTNDCTSGYTTDHTNSYAWLFINIYYTIMLNTGCNVLILAANDSVHPNKGAA